ncbi:MAG: VCBS repeat-containing protein [Nitrospira sp.]|nr:VCBS repeat-containing protein [Nitrospira sp.]
MGEKFAANPVTGTGSMSVPIATSPGRSGFGPQLSLSYDSGAGNGPFGFGWSLSLPSITRKTEKGLPQYQDSIESDVFILSGSEDLVPTLTKTADGTWEPEVVSDRTVDGQVYHIRRYRPRVEGLFARIERWTNKHKPDDTFWRSISKDNITTWYGKTAESRIQDQADPSRIFSWLMCQTYDDKGNVVVYGYKAEDSTGVAVTQVHERNRSDASRSAQRYLKRIRYGNHVPYFPELQPAASWPEPPGMNDTDGSSHWLFETVFDYDDHATDGPLPTEAISWAVRQDPFSSYRAGFEVRTYRLCQRVLMFHHFPGEDNVEANCLVRSTDFTYSHEQEPTSARNPVYTFLQEVTQTGYRRNNGGYDSRSLPPIEFTYSKPEVQDLVEEVDPESLENLPIGLNGAAYQWTDLHGEGIPGILTEQAGAWFYKRNLSPINMKPRNGEMQPEALFAPVETVAVKPNLALAGGAQFMDLAGDGLPDLVTWDGPTPGLYEHDEAEGWQPFRPFTSRLNRDLRDPNLKFVDLDGDGHADVLITEDDAFIWHPSLAEQGFDTARRVSQAMDEERGPRLVFADGTESIHLADLSGDGLTDLVRIRNGEVCYWPNLGYGTFGAKVTMDHTPHFDHPDQFDQKRIRLADINGSGTTDIIYLHRDGVRLYFNQSGNSWSQPHVLKVFPRIDEMVSVVPTDLLGNGTACLVWSSPLPGDVRQPMRYVNLMGGQKPHLLVQTRNNLGAETTIDYAPSTKFYLADKLAGKPWVTRLPFPVHVVEQVTVHDKWRNTRFSSTYSYHHGYFDGEEREFRGFGRVEQVDAEEYGTFAAGNTQSPFITDDHTLYQPPVKTISWFHTGACLNRDRVLSQYTDEYFPNWFEKQNPAMTNVLGSFRENALPEPDLAAEDLTADEWREALRACKGMVLRQETYELDVDALAHGEHVRVRLFHSAYRNCHVRCLQKRGTNPHAVFLTTESEAITYHYDLDLRPERLTPDPRIAHTLNLSIDEYGNVRQAVAVAYPRIGRHIDAALPDGAEERIAAVQRERHLAYTETRYTNDVNDSGDPDLYRLRVPCEVLSYEVTGISPDDDEDRTTPDEHDNRYFTLDELRRLQLSTVYPSGDRAVGEIAYHDRPDGSLQKRIVEHVRVLFFQDHPAMPGFLTEPLPFRRLGAIGLPYETYKLALTDSLLTAILSDKVTLEVRTALEDANRSGYLSGTAVLDRFPGEDTAGQHWVRSGIAGFQPDAATHFFLPERYTDPFGHTTTLTYDDRDLFIQSSRDPLGNTVAVTNFDYRVLAPKQIRDINDNLSEVAFDTLGLPAAVALMGKGDEGDTLAGLTDDIIDPPAAERAALFVRPYEEARSRGLLATATARHLYYFGEEVDADGTITAWDRHPPCAAGILRETHVAEERRTGVTTQLQVAFEYSDGSGNVLVKKAHAEPEAEGGPLRWIVTGKTILNNKGKPVKQYEPYFTDLHVFEESREIGVTPVMYYDAVGRLVRTELPDGTFSRVEFSPWQVTSFDPSDTAYHDDPNRQSDWYRRRTDPSHPRFAAYDAPENRRAARLAEKHANTPSTVFLDSLGREVVSIAHNRVPEDTGEYANVPLLDRPWRDEKYLTFTKLDTEGKPLWIRDARGNLVMQYLAPVKPTMWSAQPNEAIPPNSAPCYDIAGNLLFQHSMDGGDRWMLMDAAGQPFYAWDVNGVDGSEPEHRIYHTTYDDLRRPLRQRLTLDGGATWQTVERFIYGENVTDASGRNFRGQVYRHYDPSGLITNERFDFKGNLLAVTRRLASAYDDRIIHWPDNPPDSAFEAETFTQRTEYDALNRMTRLENWHRAGQTPAVYRPRYNARGLLSGESLAVNETTAEAVDNIEYDAKGQRTRIQYGNGTTTRYHYDAETLRLQQLRTTHRSYAPAFPEHRSGLRDENVLQQLSYRYDPSGNITEIYDEAYEPVFFRNQRVEPRSRYCYDSLYRLIEATGREQYGATGAPPQRLPDAPRVNFPISLSNDPNALRNYTQRYHYDSVGNLLRMAHSANGGSWTRHSEPAENSNRLERTWLGGDEVNAVHFQYDLHGSMLNLANVPDQYRLDWDTRDMIHHVNLGGGGQAWYHYDADKQRTRKRVQHNGSTLEERFYLGGMEWYRRWLNGNLVEEIETHHLFVDDQRVLMVEDVLRTDDAALGERALYRYQYGNHLGSVGLELDGGGAVISYEEYHPYGTTAYQAKNAAVSATAKRYRYTGMERDEETGLSYHTARYYLPWLGRWGSVDPIGIADGTNAFLYAHCMPTKLLDMAGTQAQSAEPRMPLPPGGVERMPGEDYGPPIPPPPPRLEGTDYDYALLSNATYREENPLPEGWLRLSEETIRDMGIDPRLFQSDEGFHAELFFNYERNEYVLGFRGTDATSLAEWLQDFSQATGGGGSEYIKAIDLAQRVHQALERQGTEESHPHLVFTGHSLGRGLAAAATILTGDEAVTFNAAGVHPETLRSFLIARNPEFTPDILEQSIHYLMSAYRLKQRITAYYVEGEIVSTAQDSAIVDEYALQQQIPGGIHAAQGRRIRLEPSTIGFGLDRTIPDLPLQTGLSFRAYLHTMPAVLSALRSHIQSP